MPTLKLPPIHKHAELFPPADASDRAMMRASLEKNGQLEEVIMLDGKILEGVNRATILINDLKVEPRYIDWNDLPEHMRRNGPLSYIIARNLDRRHLTASQKAVIAAESLPMFEEEAKQRQGARTDLTLRSKDHNVDPTSQETGFDPSAESQVRKRKGGTASAAAGKKFGVSEKSVRRAKSLLKKDPKAAAAVKAGKTTLTKAQRDEAKEKAKQAEYDKAVKRIRLIGGKAMADAVEAREILKGRREVLEYAALSDADMEKTKGLIGAGWAVKKAKKYKQTALTLNHKIGELITRAVSKGVGVGQKGAFTTEFKHPAGEFEVSVRLVK